MLFWTIGFKSEIGSRNVIIEDDKAEEADVNDSRVARRPINYSLGGFELTRTMRFCKGGSRILKYGVNFCNNVREVKYYFTI